MDIWEGSEEKMWTFGRGQKKKCGHLGGVRRKNVDIWEGSEEKKCGHLGGVRRKNVDIWEGSEEKMWTFGRGQKKKCGHLGGDRTCIGSFHHSYARSEAQFQVLV